MDGLRRTSNDMPDLTVLLCLTYPLTYPQAAHSSVWCASVPGRQQWHARDRESHAPTPDCGCIPTDSSFQTGGSPDPDPRQTVRQADYP